MGRLLIMVEKSFGGETWVNTHCAITNASPQSVLADADMTSLGIGSALTTASTASGAPTTFLQRLISFESYIHDGNVIVSRVYVTDGQRNATADPDWLWSSTLAIPGRGRINQDPLVLANGSVALVVNRNPIGYNSRGGRMFIRGLLLETEIAFNMRGGVGYQAASAATTMQTILSSALTASALSSHFNNGANVATVGYAIPHYTGKFDTTDPKGWGILKGATLVSSMAAGVPRNRQMLRGKRRKPRTAVA